jgi:pyrimidine-nucleoside phosphorylase
VDLSPEERTEVLRAHHCVFVGQSRDLAPADKKLYALRDVTGTIESVPLIASSIMSKKIAEGADALVLDVKVGHGAFMKSVDDARRLARAMVAIGARVGLPTRAVLTAMDAPLGRAVGNALEVIESLETLKGRGPADVTELAATLASHMLVMARRAPDEKAARVLVDETVRSGAALATLKAVIAAQGGDAAVVEDYGRMASADVREQVTAPRAGFVTGIDAERIGRASMMLGAGRERLDTPIHYGAGITLDVAPGAPVAAGQPLAHLHVGRADRLDEVRALAASALTIGDAPPPASPLVHDVIA